jgi:predicted flap endonuclease-1-like 5' DNA nuclease
MSHYIVELIVWSLIAYIIGCVIGWLLRKLFGAAEPVEVPAPTPVMKAVEPAPAPEPSAPEPQPMAVARMERPKGISAARGGQPDDLQQISGIGPKNEKILHTLGFFHFDQLAQWGQGEVAWVDDHLKFNGRITREKWVEQATLLAAGELEEFKRQFGSGGKK